jgi:threonine dehydratase
MSVSLADIAEAAERLSSYVRRSNLQPLALHDNLTSSVWVKEEHDQLTGSFKIRGAFFSLLRLLDGPPPRAVVVASSGNHGHAVAYAAQRLGLPSVVVVPHSTPQFKIRMLRATRTEVLTVRPDQRESVAARVRDERQFVLLPSDAPDVIAGQGTIGLEIAEQMPDASRVYLPVGNGGLLAGVAVALTGLGSSAHVVGVEPELAADAAESFRRRRLTRWPVRATYRTVADGLRVPVLGRVAWPYVRELASAMETVTEDDIRSAMVRLFQERSIVAEPSGAVAVAAAVRHSSEYGGEAIAVLTGGNVDPEWFRSIVEIDRLRLSPASS